jgi:hypothetical protein
MHNNVSNIVRVIFNSFDLFGSVIVVDAQLGIIRAYYDPLLARYKFSTSDRRVCYLE